MKRKTFIQQIGYSAGAAFLLPSAGFLNSCEYKPSVRERLTETDLDLLNEIGETIIPTTAEVPGAKAAKIGDYILVIYNDCMSEENQQILVSGLNTLDLLSSKTFSSSFIKAKAPLREELLAAVQAEAITHRLNNEGNEDADPHYFDILKELTLSGYFTSEIGMTQARKYLPVPSIFISCMNYSKNDKVWAL